MIKHLTKAITTLLLFGGLSVAYSQGNSPKYRLIEVGRGLEHPWGMAWLPDGSILITERPGRLRIIRKGILDPKPISGLPKVFSSGQGGLLDITLHPQFAQNQWIYFTYAAGNDQANQTRVARARWNGQSLTDLKTIFAVSPQKSGDQHFGSRLAWLPDQTLLISIGDGGNPPLQLENDLIRKQAQNRRSHLGKILRLRDDGTIPADNPFRQDRRSQAAIWSYGHRNIQGLTFDPIRQQVWASEHGSRGGDEVNLIKKGKNYGWPLATFSNEYYGPPISRHTSLPGMVDPKLVWTSSIAPSGLVTYTGDRFPQWRGNLFAGGLVSQQLHRLEINDQGKVIKQENISIGQRVRDVRQGPDGLLYVLTDARRGQLMRIEPQ